MTDESKGELSGNFDLISLQMIESERKNEKKKFVI